MNIGFIGAGKVGTTIGRHLYENYVSNEKNENKLSNNLPEIKIAGYYSRSIKSSTESADFTKSKYFDNLETLVNLSDTLFITTNDDEIKNVWDCIKEMNLTNKVICHLSGSLSSDIFSNIKDKSIYTCSIHPAFAFSDKFTTYKKFNYVHFVCEGNENAIKILSDIFIPLGHKFHLIKSEDKTKYHLSMVFASNLYVALINSSVNLLNECGFQEKESLDILATLTKNNLDSIINKGTKDSLTGPVERNDINTIKKHLSILDTKENENNKEIYKALTENLINIAKNKHPEYDYNELESLIN